MDAHKTLKFSLDEYDLILEEILEPDFNNLRPINFSISNKILLINNPRKADISIFNHRGTKLYSNFHEKGTIRINLAKLRGSYFLKIDNQKNEIYIN